MIAGVLILTVSYLAVVLVKKFVVDKMLANYKELRKGLAFLAILGAHYFGVFLSSVSWPAIAIVTTGVVITIASHFLLSPADHPVHKKSRSQKPKRRRNSDQLTKSDLNSESNNAIASLADIELDLLNKLISSLWPSVYRGITENVIQPFCQERFQDWAKAKNLDELANLSALRFDAGEKTLPSVLKCWVDDNLSRIICDLSYRDTAASFVMSKHDAVFVNEVHLTNFRLRIDLCNRSGWEAVLLKKPNISHSISFISSACKNLKPEVDRVAGQLTEAILDWITREIVFPNGVLLSLDAPKLMFYKTQKFVKVVLHKAVMIEGPKLQTLAEDFLKTNLNTVTKDYDKVSHRHPIEPERVPKSIAAQVSVGGITHQTKAFSFAPGSDGLNFEALYPFDNLDDFEVKVEVITNTDSENKVIGSFFERLDVLKEENPYSNIYSVQFTSFIFDSSSDFLRSSNKTCVKCVSCERELVKPLSFSLQRNFDVFGGGFHNREGRQQGKGAHLLTQIKSN